MPREKFAAGERAEVKCFHLRAGQVVEDWLAGRVVQADYRMAAVRFDSEVFTSSGQRVPDRILWCAHGSPNIRRPAADADSHTHHKENTHG
jgi:hypothetical protein